MRLESDVSAAMVAVDLRVVLAGVVLLAIIIAVVVRWLSTLGR